MPELMFAYLTVYGLVRGLGVVMRAFGLRQVP